MIKLSVNVNKVATLRNARGGAVPSVLRAVETCVDAGAPGITVHPRADDRHIRAADVHEIAAWLRRRRDRGEVVPEFNIEGDPRPDLIAMVKELRPTQCTLVPVMPGEITSQAGWATDSDPDTISDVVADVQSAGVRVSVFIEARDDAVDWAAATGAERVELYTEPFARAYAARDVSARASFDAYTRAAERAHARGLGINAGHDLDLENLRLFRTLPHLAEVSIGHALVSHALWVGLDRAVREYRRVIEEGMINPAR
jgi:pyridoxine 5-phosphate synthase